MKTEKKTVTGEAVTVAALSLALKAATSAVKNKGAIQSRHDAGMVELTKTKRAQVFVQVCLFDQELLNKRPDTGGLVHLAQESDASKKRDGKIRAALDELAIALTSKNHKWTPTQRKAYDAAIKLLDI